MYDEHVEGFIERALNALQIAMPVLPPAPTSPAQYEQVYNEAVRQVVETSANTGRVVIVGRTGQVILANRSRRAARAHHRAIAQAHQLRGAPRGAGRSAAQARIQFKDRDRARYIQTQYARDINDPTLYDLVINTGVIDLDGAVDLVLLALEHKASRKSVPTGELGPVAGLEPYAARPADLRPTAGKDE